MLARALDPCGSQVEHVIRQDFTIEAYEILELLCELVHERMRLIVAEKECPIDLQEAVCTLIWWAETYRDTPENCFVSDPFADPRPLLAHSRSSPRTECPELEEVSKQFRLKYGKEFYERAVSNADFCVNDRVAQKLSVQPPTAFMVSTQERRTLTASVPSECCSPFPPPIVFISPQIQQYLVNIAKEYQVDWTPTDTGLTEDELSTHAMPGEPPRIYTQFVVFVIG